MLCADAASVAIGGRHLDGSGCSQRGAADDLLDAVLAEQELHPVRVLGDDLLLAPIHASPVERQPARCDAELRRAFDGLVEGRRLQERLRGDAAAKEAGPARALFLIDYAGLEAVL